MQSVVDRALQEAGGWLGFDRFMQIALYSPGLGYYARGDRQFGAMPASGSDFVTAPELTPLYGRALSRQVRQALQETQTDEVFEFGAGSGALAAQLLDALANSDASAGGLRCYSIVDLSGALRERQQHRLAAWGDRVRWLDRWPETMDGVVVGNEVLDAMPVQLLRWDGERWLERGVGRDPSSSDLTWVDQPTGLRPPVPGPFTPGTVTEIHPHALAFVRSLADRLRRGAAFFIDYGFPDAEYYHPQRRGGTLMCHRAHRADDDPLVDVGLKDITAHVDFSAIALTAQEAGLTVLGYTSQARFLMNCGLLDDLRDADARSLAAAQTLLQEHEMGELFKVIGLVRGTPFDAIGFTAGDRSHTL